VTVVYGDRRSGAAFPLVNARSGATVFEKPADDIGTKSIADYATYARLHVHDVNLPNGSAGRLFVGQRKDPFVVALGKAFDLVNLNPVGPVNANEDKLADKNVTALVLEVPIDPSRRRVRRSVPGRRRVSAGTGRSARRTTPGRPSRPGRGSRSRASGCRS
jgi:hypothetical protein